MRRLGILLAGVMFIGSPVAIAQQAQSGQQGTGAPGTSNGVSPRLQVLQRVDRQVAFSAQEKLKGLGYDPGPVDGLIGPQSQAAIRNFQQAKGLDTTGRLDSDTLAALDVPSSGAPGNAPAGGTEAGAMEDQPDTGGYNGSSDGQSM